MPQLIQWDVAVKVGGTSQLAAARSMLVEAVDSIRVSVVAGAADVEVQVQPSATAGDVTFLAVSASAYHATDLSYKVNADTEPAHALSEPVVLAGAGAVGLLDGAPRTLFFTNATAEEVEIQIIAGRDATPPP